MIYSITKQVVITIENDELRLYRGEDFIVSPHIRIHQPTLNEICDYGEKEYYSMICQLTATPQNLKFQLWDIGIDYTQVTAFQLFYSLFYKLYPPEKTSILFGNLDFTKFEVLQRKDDASIFLYQAIVTDDHHTEPLIIDEYTYNVITDYIRNVHFIEKDERLPVNEATKLALIEDDRDAWQNSQSQPGHSQLKNLVSSMVNSEGFKYNHSQVWDMKINAFMDSVKRISKIQNAALLLQSGYSGFGVNLKEIDNKQLNWLGELE